MQKLKLMRLVVKPKKSFKEYLDKANILKNNNIDYDKVKHFSF